MHLLLHVAWTAVEIALMLVGGALALTVACYAMLAVYYAAISPFIGLYWLTRRLLKARADRVAA